MSIFEEYWKSIIKTGAEEVECPGCKGSGLCSYCNGRPQYGYTDQRGNPLNPADMHHYDPKSMKKIEVPCKACKGANKCDWCFGNGTLPSDEMSEIREKFNRFLVTGE